MKRKTTPIDEIKEKFSCECAGETVIINETTIRHRCQHYYTAQKTGGNWAFYDRVQVNPDITGGATKFNWWLRWS